MRNLLIGVFFAISALPISAQDVPAPGDELSLRPGLAGKFLNIGMDMKKFPEEVTCQPANCCRVDGLINFDVREGRGFGALPWKEEFAAVWTGMVRVPKDAEVTFYLKSHDGSKLYVDGVLWIDHDGTHPIKETASKTMRLSAGNHDLELKYFQNKPEGRLILSWKYDGIEKEVIPSTALWHSYEKDVDAK